MKFDEFNSLRDQALMLYTSQQGDPSHHVGLDAIFAAVVAMAHRKPGRPRVVRAAPPEWFGEALKELSGKRVTASDFLVLSGRMPVTDDDRRNVGRWLRDAGKKPRKMGGQLLFQL